MKIFKVIYFIICTLYLPVLPVVAAIVDGGWFGTWFDLAFVLLLLVTLPFYIAFVQIGRCIFKNAEKESLPKYEKVLMKVETSLALCSVIGVLVALIFQGYFGIVGLVGCFLSVVVVLLFIIELVIKLKNKTLTKFAKRLVIGLVIIIAAMGAAQITVRQVDAYKWEKRMAFHVTPSILDRKNLRSRGEDMEFDFKVEFPYSEYKEAYESEDNSILTPQARLIYQGEEEYVIDVEIVSFEDEKYRHSLWHKVRRTTQYKFTVPTDAPKGEYVLEMTFGDISWTENKFLIVQK